MAEFLLELLSEEIPAGMQERAAADLARLVTDGLKGAGLTFDTARAFSGPRRLTLVIDGLPERQPDRKEERKGPRADAPEKAIEGFLKSVGLTRDQVEERETKKGAVLFAVIEKKGRPTANALLDLVGDVVIGLPWPKSMYWPDMQLVAWVRPLRKILAVFGRQALPIAAAGTKDARYDYYGVQVESETFGHPLQWPEPSAIPDSAKNKASLPAPKPFAVKDFAEYESKLRAAHVILDAEERKDIIRDGAAKLAKAEGLTLVEDEALVTENAGLVEWPVPLMGRIDEAFLELPPEVLRASMRTHQKYFALNDAAGKLAPRFVVIANIEAKDGGKAIVAGNERVLRARLADAKFFWDQDRKRTLASRVPGGVNLLEGPTPVGTLDQIVFHSVLGSLLAKAYRLETLSKKIAERWPGAAGEKENVGRAALLAKADLVTQMVVEFPGLQGVMGRYYALADGEHEDVARAIAEHYAPQGPDDICPTAPVSVAVALADKIDTLVGFFGNNEQPSGSKDPFALRRAALGIIRLIIENQLALPLRSVLEEAHHLYRTQITLWFAAENTAKSLMAFIADRLKVHLRERGVRHDLIAAVFALTGEDDLVRLLARVEALQNFLGGEDGANLLTAYKRASNIVRIEEKKDGGHFDDDTDTGRFEVDEERTLYASLGAVKDQLSDALRAENYDDAFRAFATLRPPIDSFFDNVKVNVDDRDVRANRLRLLSRINVVFDSVADFSQIEG